jgi:hypothetical protein
MNNNNTHHPSNRGAQQQQQRHQRQRNEQSSRNGSSGAPASVNVEALELDARISVLEEEEVAQALRLRDASHDYSSASSNSLSEYATAATATAAREGRDMQILQLRIPTKSENALPGPTLNPASCASGLALLDGDWTSAQSRIALAEGMNDGQGDTHRRNSSLENEEWDDFDLPQGNEFRGGDSN